MRLYSTNCPKCHVIETKLTQKGLDFELVTDMDRIKEIAEKCGIASAPLLELDTGEILDFVAANKWLASK